MDQITAELEKKLGSAVERMPAFPKSVQRILELTRNINCRPKDLVGVIEKDPVITIKVLQTINSAYYGLPKKITSINQSTVFLGINTIKNLALTFSVIGILPSTNGADFDMQHYLMSTLVTANIGRQLGAKFPAPDTDSTDYYLAGLLHDFGKVVFALFMEAEFRQALALSADENLSLHAAEQKVIGADHTLVGAMLAKRWQFPGYMIECIAGHHGPDYPTPLAQCLRVADLVAAELGYDAKGNILADDVSPELPARFGGDLSKVIAALGDVAPLIEEARQFSQAGH